MEKSYEKNDENEKEKEFEKRLEDNELKIMTTFKKIKTNISDYIIHKIRHHKRMVNNSLKILYGKKKEEEKQKTLVKIKKIKILTKSKSSLNFSNISKNIKNLKKIINSKINKVNKSQEDLALLNNLDNDNKINSKNKFQYLTNNYHKQLNLAFLNFNPLKYSNNLKILLNLSQSERDDISKTKLEIEEDINKINSKKIRSKIFQKIKTSKNSNKKFRLPNILLDKTYNFNKKESRNKKEIGINISKNKSKENTNIFENDYNSKINKLHNLSKEIDKYIGDENIKEKIDKHVDDFYKYKNESFFNNDYKDSIFKPKNYYLVQDNKINEMFAELNFRKSKYKIKEENIKKLCNKLAMHKTEFFDKINFDMKSTFKDLDDFINSQKIDINKKEQED